MSPEQHCSTHSHTYLTHTWTGGTHLCPSHLHSQPHLPHPYLDRRDTPLSLPPPLTATPPSPIPGQEGHTSVPPTSTHSHTSLSRRDTPLSLPPPLTATPPSPIPGQEGHTSVPPTSTHSHTSLSRRDTPLSLPPPLTATPPSPIPGQEGHTFVPPTSTHSHTSLTHIYLDTLKKRILNQSSSKNITDHARAEVFIVVKDIICK